MSRKKFNRRRSMVRLQKFRESHWTYIGIVGGVIALYCSLTAWNHFMVPRLDVSSQAAVDSSRDAMLDSLSEPERPEFVACMLASVLPDGPLAMLPNGALTIPMSKKQWPDESTRYLVFKPLEGMTATEIINKGRPIIAKLRQEGKAKKLSLPTP